MNTGPVFTPYYRYREAQQSRTGDGDDSDDGADDNDAEFAGDGHYCAVEHVMGWMVFQSWFPSPTRPTSQAFSASVLHVDIDGFRHLSYDDAWTVYRKLLRTAQKKSLQDENKQRYPSNSNVRSQLSFDTLTPPWFCGKINCHVTNVSLFDPYLEFDVNSLLRKRNLRRKTPICIAKLHGLITSFYQKEPDFTTAVINHFMQKCSSPLPTIPPVNANTVRIPPAASNMV